MNESKPTPMPRTRRRAITLAEVLIAMGILTIGLLGVAAIFPVGGHYMQSGDIADRGGAIAQAALEDAIIRGHLNPENWVHLNFDRAREVLAGSSNPVLKSFALPIPELSALGLNGPAEPFAGGLAKAISLPDSAVPSTLGTRERYLGMFYGGAYVIDPIGFGAAMDETTTSVIPTAWKDRTASAPIRRFPATTGYIGYRLVAQADSPTWWPWDLPSAAFNPWPVRRILTTSIARDLFGNDPGRSTLATDLFTTTDDLALSLPTSGDSPAQQSFEAWNNNQTGTEGLPSRRQARGDYSWLLTVAPASDAARNALATTPDAYPMDVSAVVFHKRTVGRGAEAARENERLVTARVVSNSPGGGELLLERRPIANDPVTTSPFEGLRGGEYVMVVGPHPQSTSDRPRLALRWCRVLGIQDSGQLISSTAPITLDGENAVLVSLRGPDWPWQQATNLTTNSISNDLRVAIVPGAVAVHTKTMRLGTDEGLEWTSN